MCIRNSQYIFRLHTLKKAAVKKKFVSTQRHRTITCSRSEGENLFTNGMTSDSTETVIVSSCCSSSSLCLSLCIEREPGIELVCFFPLVVSKLSLSSSHSLEKRNKARDPFLDMKNSLQTVCLFFRSRWQWMTWRRHRRSSTSTFTTSWRQTQTGIEIKEPERKEFPESNSFPFLSVSHFQSLVVSSLQFQWLKCECASSIALFFLWVLFSSPFTLFFSFNYNLEFPFHLMLILHSFCSSWTQLLSSSSFFFFFPSICSVILRFSNQSLKVNFIDYFLCSKTHSINSYFTTKTFSDHQQNNNQSWAPTSIQGQQSMSTDHRGEHQETWRWNTGLIWVPSPGSRSVVINVRHEKVLHIHAV